MHCIFKLFYFILFHESISGQSFKEKVPATFTSAIHLSEVMWNLSRSLSEENEVATSLRNVTIMNTTDGKQYELEKLSFQTNRLVGPVLLI